MPERAGSAHPGESMFAWQDDLGELAPTRARSGRPSVADSWVVDNGCVRRLDLHLARFSTSCRAGYGRYAAGADRFLAAVREALPGTGEWFPRIEFEYGKGFRLRLRPTPERGGEVVLWVADQPDSRVQPTVKGPDLDLLTALREEAARRGANEALLTTRSGIVLEGALSSVLWWRGDVLCAPPLTLPVLPGVTRATLLSIAAEAGTQVCCENCHPEDLDGAEVWVVSALHGIRAVTGWAGSGLRAGTARRAEAWQARLAATAAPVVPRSGAAGRDR
jgi:branched-subunit amino acid aminotransferase/4-amino-4-deoxychorismate lyase